MIKKAIIIGLFCFVILIGVSAHGGVMFTDLRITGDVYFADSVLVPFDFNGILSQNGEFEITNWTIAGQEAYKTGPDVTAHISFPGLERLPDGTGYGTELSIPGVNGNFSGFDLQNDLISANLHLYIEDPTGALTFNNLYNYYSSKMFSDSSIGNFYYLVWSDSDQKYHYCESYNYTVSLSAHVFPEPSTILLMGAGLVGIGFLRKRITI